MDRSVSTIEKGPDGQGGLTFACPVCRGGLVSDGPDALCCPADGSVYRREGGIWRFLPAGRLSAYEQFVREYETVRRAEGRASPDSAYYQALPFRDLTGRNSDNWRIRAKSFQALLTRAVEPLEKTLGRPLVVLDLGAGNGWLSYQLARRGYRAAAVDLLVNDFDGLGCHVHYDAAFTPVQAEFERLPFADGSVDLVVFNASLHYSTDYAATIAEALRVLRSQGILVVVDSPVYHDASSGAQMVREREAQFLKKYGFASNSVASENYLTYDRLAELAKRLGLRWERIEPFYGLGWALRPWRARLRGHREPAKFMVLFAQREGMEGREGTEGRGTQTGGREGGTGAEQDRQDGQDGSGLGEANGLVPSSYPGNPVHPVPVTQPFTPSPPLALSHSVRTRAWRLVTKLRYKALARGRYDALVMEEVAGKPILVLPGVFNPKLLRTGEILVRVLDSRLVPRGSTVLDMGTGSGIGAVFAADWAGRVTAVDLNPEAVRCARINALLNRVEDRVEVLQGDLFGPVGDRRFDVVLFNPPYYRGVPKDKLDMAWRSPDVLERFAAELPAHLAPGGHALVILSSDGEQAAFLEAFRAAGLVIGVAVCRDLGNEVVIVYRLSLIRERVQGAAPGGVRGVLEES